MNARGSDSEDLVFSGSDESVFNDIDIENLEADADSINQDQLSAEEKKELSVLRRTAAGLKKVINHKYAVAAPNAAKPSTYGLTAQYLARSTPDSLPVAVPTTNLAGLGPMLVGASLEGLALAYPENENINNVRYWWLLASELMKTTYFSVQTTVDFYVFLEEFLKVADRNINGSSSDGVLIKSSLIAGGFGLAHISVRVATDKVAKQIEEMENLPRLRREDNHDARLKFLKFKSTVLRRAGYFFNILAFSNIMQSLIVSAEQLNGTYDRELDDRVIRHCSSLAAGAIISAGTALLLDPATTRNFSGQLSAVALSAVLISSFLQVTETSKFLDETSLCILAAGWMFSIALPYLIHAGLSFNSAFAFLSNVLQQIGEKLGCTHHQEEGLSIVAAEDGYGSVARDGMFSRSASRVESDSEEKMQHGNLNPSSRLLNQSL